MTNKHIALFLLTMIAIGGGGGAVYANEYDHLDNGTQICGDHICKPGEFKLRHDALSEAQRGTPAENFQYNYFFTKLITPTGAHLDNFILSKDNYTALKNNVGVFTACGSFDNGFCTPPLATTAQPSIGYCPIAKLIHENEDGYANKTVGTSTIYTWTTPPSYCDSELNPPIPVPEFGPIASIILVIAIIVSIVIISTRKKQCHLGTACDGVPAGKNYNIDGHIQVNT